MNDRRIALAATAALALHLVAGGPVRAAPGDPDRAFGDGGIVVAPPGSGDDALDLAIQPDGRIVVAGVISLAGAGLRGVLLRYLPDGTLDPAFGGGGIARVEPAPGEAVVFGVALQADGRIVAAGYSRPDAFDVTSFALVRHLADGTPDGSFGTDGSVVTTLGPVGVANAVVVQPDGRIVVAGRNREDDETLLFPDRFALLRHLPDGTLDPSFGAAGVVLTPVGRDASAAAIALQPDGRLVVAGSALNAAGDYDFAVARYHADGMLDASFGQGGIVTTALAGFDVVRGLALLDDGRIVLAGQTAAQDGDVALVRYRPDGSLDPAFGRGGVSILSIDPASADVTDLARQADGRLVVAGYSAVPGVTSYFDFNVWRFLADGTPDPTFGAGGAVTQRFGPNGGIPGAVGIQRDGRILAAGSNSASGLTTALTVVRYLNARCVPAARPRLEVDALATAASDGVFRLAGTIAIPTEPAVSPGANGVTVTWGDATGVIVDVTLAGDGTSGGGARTGWRANGPRTRFAWTGSGPVNKVTFRGHRKIPGRYQVTVVGERAGSARPLLLPLWATVTLVRPFAGSEQCAEWTFAGPRPLPSCVAGAGADHVGCR